MDELLKVKRTGEEAEARVCDPQPHSGSIVEVTPGRIDYLKEATKNTTTTAAEIWWRGGCSPCSSLL
jgi:hypothetical protein